MADTLTQIREHLGRICEGLTGAAWCNARAYSWEVQRRSVGRDVLRETTREQYVEAIKPLTGLTPDEFAVNVRRIRLSSVAKAECVSLDGGIADVEVLRRSASVGARTAVQHDLFNLSKRCRELGC